MCNVTLLYVEPSAWVDYALVNKVQEALILILIQLTSVQSFVIIVTIIITITTTMFMVLSS